VLTPAEELSGSVAKAVIDYMWTFKKP